MYVNGSDGRPKYNRIYNNQMEAPDELMRITDSDYNLFQVRQPGCLGFSPGDTNKRTPGDNDSHG